VVVEVQEDFEMDYERARELRLLRAAKGLIHFTKKFDPMLFGIRAELDVPVSYVQSYNWSKFRIEVNRIDKLNISKSAKMQLLYEIHKDIVGRGRLGMFHSDPLVLTDILHQIPETKRLEEKKKGSREVVL